MSGDVRVNTFEYFERALVSDDGFREYDCRWILGRGVNPNGFLLLGRAYGTYLKRLLGTHAAVVGHDFRAYSQDLARSFIIGLLAAGVDVHDIGLALTPMVYFAQYQYSTRGAAMITASHNENGWTGIKLANNLSSTLGEAEIGIFKSIVTAADFEEGAGRYMAHTDLLSAYTLDFAPRRLSGSPTVVVAAGNGTAGHFAPQLLRMLGCSVVELDCDGDWTFPHHNPNPEDMSFLSAISAATRNCGASLGIGIDGDGDRLGVVDDQGRELFSDKLGLLLARWMSRAAPRRNVVVDVKSTSLFLDDKVLAAAGWVPLIWKTGHSHIKEKVSSAGAIAGFEKSGHFFFAPPYGRGYDDALLSASLLLQMLEEAGRPLSVLADELPQTWQSPTLSVYCSDGDKYNVVQEATEQYVLCRDNGGEVAGSRIRDILLINGVRFSLESGAWGVIRASSNKPCIVLVAESRQGPEELRLIIDHMKDQLARTGRVGAYEQDLAPRSPASISSGGSA